MKLSRVAQPIAGLLVIFGIMFGLLFARQQGLDLPVAVRGLTFLLVIPAIWLTLVYWGRIDEAAREAQKTAYFWGGSFGAGLGLIAASLLQDAPNLPAMASTQPFFFGACVAVGVQLACFILAWAYWWMSKR